MNIDERLLSIALRGATLWSPKLVVMIYHRVLEKPDWILPNEVDRSQFAQHLDWIRGLFNVLPLGVAVERLKSGTLQGANLCITFDDGYLDNATVALEELKIRNLPATFFCTTAFKDDGMMWNDLVIEAVRIWPDKPLEIAEINFRSASMKDPSERITTLNRLLNNLKYIDFAARQEIANRLASQAGISEKKLMMSDFEIKKLASSGMEIGGHTHGHPILARVAPQIAKSEIVINKGILEEIIGDKISNFAYPNGKPEADYGVEHIQMLESVGYQSACTTYQAFCDRKVDLMQIPRFTPWDKTSLRFRMRMIAGFIKPCDQRELLTTTL